MKILRGLLSVTILLILLIFGYRAVALNSVTDLFIVLITLEILNLLIVPIYYKLIEAINYKDKALCQMMFSRIKKMEENNQRQLEKIINTNLDITDFSNIYREMNEIDKEFYKEDSNTAGVENE